MVRDMSAALQPSHSDVSVEIRSALPGRFRVWVAGLYRNDELKRALEQGLNGAESQREVAVNLTIGTLLVTAPKETQPDTLVEEITALVRDFAEARSLSLADLERRGRVKPVHLARARSGTARGARVRLFSASEFLARISKDESRPKQQSVPDEPPGEQQAVHLWHTLSTEQVHSLVGGSPGSGLCERDAEERLQRFRRNALPRVKQRSSLAMFLDQFKELPVMLLAGSTVLSMLTGGVADGFVILGVIVINGVIGFVTESTAERTIASLTREDAPDVDVIRQGVALQIPMDGIVPGDLILLRPGSLVPADSRVIDARELTIDESALTGESMPVTKTTGVLESLDLPIADRTNMVYRGTLVTGGSGSAVVVATGRATQVGQLQTMVAEVSHPETPMQKQLRHLGERTVVIAGAVCGGVLVLGLLRGQALGSMLRTAVSLAVAAVPEGLPTVAITTLAIGIRKMKEQHVLVRRLDAIETLGSVQVLCFDKTGTITENRMRVVQATVADSALSVDSGKLRTADRELAWEHLPELRWLLQVAALCSEAELVTEDDGVQRARGSSTEAALVDVALAAGVDVARLRLEHPISRAEHRTEERKLMATIHRSAEASSR
jgi:Ca2+-transporting ATPase